MDTQELKEIAGSLSFWVVVFNAVVAYLWVKGWVGNAELTFVTSIAAPFVAINQTRKAAKDIGGLNPSATEKADKK